MDNLSNKTSLLGGKIKKVIKGLKKALTEEIRGVRNADGDNNPFDAYQIRNNIVDTLSKEGFFNKKDYIIIEVPNIVDISYGRKVGYTFTEYDLGEEIHNISSTKIRKNMREKGELS